MQRNCDYCGAAYEAKRSTSRYCKPAHRVSMSQRGKPKASVTEANVTELPTPKDTPEEEPKSTELPPLVAAVALELANAERFNTSLGQQAFYLATRIATASFDTGSSIASMSRELREVMSRAMEGVAVADDPLDELKRRRELKLAGG
jgi:hypothetical protein